MLLRRKNKLPLMFSRKKMTDLNYHRFLSLKSIVNAKTKAKN